MKKKLLEFSNLERPIHDVPDSLLINDFPFIYQPLPKEAEADSVSNIDEPEDSKQPTDAATETIPGISIYPEDIQVVQLISKSSYGKHVLNDDFNHLMLMDSDLPSIVPSSGISTFPSLVGFGHDPLFEPSYLYELIGNTKDNEIRGNSLNNLLDGKTGADTLVGGKGDDTYIVDNVFDKVIEQVSQGQQDKVISSISYALTDNVENLELVGKRDLSGDGNALDNMIKGNSGDNQIIGNAGDDTLRGNLGEDTLTGGAGDDVFVFSQRDSSGGADLITDFEVGVDKIVVSNLVQPLYHYTNEGGPLTFSFESGKNIDASHTNGALFSYNTKTGKLYFDHDGAGGDDAVQFAILKNAPTITAADLEVMNIYIPPCAVGDDNPYDFFINI